MVESCLAEGRRVIPFDIQLPDDSAYYLVYPEERGASAKVEAFTGWILRTLEHEQSSVDAAV